MDKGNSIKFTVNIPVADYAKIVAVSDSRNETMAEVVRQWISLSVRNVEMNQWGRDFVAEYGKMRPPKPRKKASPLKRILKFIRGRH